MEVVADNTRNTLFAHTNNIGSKRTLTQIKRASFLNQVYGPAYQSVEYLKENPEAVWVIRDGEYPELYFTMLNNITLSEVENGTIAVDKAQAVDGEVVTVTAVPDENYVLNKIYVNGNEIVGTTFEVSGDSDVYNQHGEEYNCSNVLIGYDETFVWIIDNQHFSMPEDYHNSVYEGFYLQALTPELAEYPL